MNHPIHHVKHMFHLLKNRPVAEHKHWPIGPLLFYLVGIFFLAAYFFSSSDWRMDFLITSFVCLIFAFILGEMIVHMIDA